MSPATGSILCVDDSPVVLRTLAAILERQGYRVRRAGGGEEALQLAEEEVPDLFLLDVLMPGMNGLELCRRLRAEARYAGLPIVFITALDNKDDIVAGFAAGADDYIGKPFNAREVVARVEAHLNQLRLVRENERYATEMETLARERAEALVHAERLATLGTLSAGIAHEINNPAAVLAGNTQMLRKLLPALQQAVERAREAGGPEPQLDFAAEELPTVVEDLEGGVERIRRIVNHMKRFARRGEADRLGGAAAAESVRDALDLCQNALKYHARVRTEVADGLPPLRIDAQELQQVLVNLLVNAADALEEKGGGEVLVRVNRDGADVVISVEDDGPGFTEEALGRLFEPFFTTKPEGKGTGLGLTISQGILKRYGGALEAENRPGGGALFRLRVAAEE